MHSFGGVFDLVGLFGVAKLINFEPDVQTPTDVTRPINQAQRVLKN